MFNNNNNYDIPSYTEECIIQHWLQGKTRDEIAQAFGISKGTVSNIIAKFRNKLGHRDFDAMREFAKKLLRQNMTLDNCAIGFRVHNIMEKLKISEAKTEEFLTTVFEFAQKKGISPEILREALIEFYKISQKVPFSQIPSYLQKMMEEIEETENKKNQVKEEIQTLEKEKLAKEEQVRSGLREANTTLFHLNNYIETKFKLAKFGIIVEDIDRFTRCVEGIGRYSNYDPFKVIEKFSDREALEIGIENNQKIKNNLEINIQKLKETESEYNDRLNLKYIKLKNLDELEKIVGFTIQDLKKLKGILMEIALEDKNLNIEQLKAIFFELIEKLEDRIALEKENNTKMKLNPLLENQIKSKRQTLHCQAVVGPILKNLFDVGIGEREIVAIKCLNDLILNYKGNDDTTKLKFKPEVIMDLSIYDSNSRLKKENLKRAVNFVLNAANFRNLQSNTYGLINLNEFSSSLVINNPANENEDNRNRVGGAADSII